MMSKQALVLLGLCLVLTSLPSASSVACLRNNDCFRGNTCASANQGFDTVCCPRASTCTISIAGGKCTCGGGSSSTPRPTASATATPAASGSATPTPTPAAGGSSSGSSTGGVIPVLRQFSADLKAEVSFDLGGGGGFGGDLPGGGLGGGLSVPTFAIDYDCPNGRFKSTLSPIYEILTPACDTKIQVNTQTNECKTLWTPEVVYPMDVPEIAQNKGTETVGSDTCTNYEFSLGPSAAKVTLNIFLKDSTVDGVKAPCKAIYKSEVAGAGQVTVTETYSNVVAKQFSVDDATFTIPENCPDVPTCGAPMNVAIVLDGSGSIADGDFTKMKAFTKDVINKFEIGNSGPQLAVIQFSSASTTEIPFGTSKADMLTAVDGLSQQKGGTNMIAALDNAKTILDKQTGNTKIVLFVTDGEPNSDPTTKANELKNAGITIVSIGVGGGIARSSLAKLASPDTDKVKYVIQISNFDALSKAIDGIVKDACLSEKLDKGNLGPSSCAGDDSKCKGSGVGSLPTGGPVSTPQPTEEPTANSTSAPNPTGTPPKPTPPPFNRPSLPPNGKVPPPALPQQFSADVEIKLVIGESELTSQLPIDANGFSFKGKMHYDFPGRRVTQVGPDGSKQINLYTTRRQYNVTGGGDCKCGKLEGDFDRMVIPPFATNTMNETVNGKSAARWEAKWFGLKLAWWLDLGTPTVTLLRFQQNVSASAVESNLPGGAGGLGGSLPEMGIQIDFSTFDGSAPAESVFTPPTGCTCEQPAAKVVASSCPNAPSGCKCSLSGNNYCSEINYPVPSSLCKNPSSSTCDVSFNDNFVKDAVESTIWTLEVAGALSDTCKESLKSYFCAFYFPRCSSDGLELQLCADACPFCQCEAFGKGVSAAGVGCFAGLPERSADGDLNCNPGTKVGLCNGNDRGPPFSSLRVKAKTVSVTANADTEFSVGDSEAGDAVSLLRVYVKKGAFKSGVSLNVKPLGDSEVKALPLLSGFNKLEDFAGSAIIEINAGTEQPSEAVTLSFDVKSEVKDNLQSYCLGWVDESAGSKVWKCQDTALRLSTDDSSKVEGDTTHFSQFAVIRNTAGPAPSSGGSSGGGTTGGNTGGSSGGEGETGGTGGTGGKDDGGGGSNTGAIVGAIIGVLVVGGAIGGVVFWKMNQNKSSPKVELPASTSNAGVVGSTAPAAAAPAAAPETNPDAAQPQV